MSGPPNLRELKRSLRKEYHALRCTLPSGQKAEYDKEILLRLNLMALYKDASLMLCYVSTPEEAGTHSLITSALDDGKRVAVPYLIDRAGDMRFHEIRSLCELSPRTRGILEPEPRNETAIKDFSASICIVPGLAFDMEGYRLGYGGGYYDRFLCKYDGAAIGLCYRCCLTERLYHGPHDVPCGYIITEEALIITKNAPDSQGR